MLPLLGPAACDLNLERPDRPFELDQVPGAYFGQGELVEIDCPDGAPELLPPRSPVEVALDGSSMTVDGLPARLRGPVDSGGRFVLTGYYESPLGVAATSLQGSFLDPDAGRGFVALLEIDAPACRQRYRLRAY